MSIFLVTPSMPIIIYGSVFMCTSPVGSFISVTTNMYLYVERFMKNISIYAGCPSVRGINVSTFQSINLVMTYY